MAAIDILITPCGGGRPAHARFIPQAFLNVYTWQQGPSHVARSTPMCVTLLVACIICICLLSHHHH